MDLSHGEFFFRNTTLGVFKECGVNVNNIYSKFINNMNNKNRGRNSWRRTSGRVKLRVSRRG